MSITVKEILQLVLQGGPGFCQIALTNVCNAHCRFCNFPQVPPASRVMADSRRLFQGLAGIGYTLLRLARPDIVPDVLLLTT